MTPSATHRRAVVLDSGDDAAFTHTALAAHAPHAGRITLHPAPGTTSDTALAGDLLVQGEDTYGYPRVGVGVLLFEASLDGRHLSAGLFERHALLEPADGEVGMRASRLAARDGADRRPELHRVADDAVSEAQAGGELKACRHDPHDRVALVVERDRFADYLPVGAEAALPERVAQYDDGRPARTVLFVRE